MQVLEKNNVKQVISRDYNYLFNKKSGYFARWGKTKEDDPQLAPFPEILDLEISSGNISSTFSIGNLLPFSFFTTESLISFFINTHLNIIVFFNRVSSLSHFSSFSSSPFSSLSFILFLNFSILLRALFFFRDLMRSKAIRSLSSSSKGGLAKEKDEIREERFSSFNLFKFEVNSISKEAHSISLFSFFFKYLVS